MSVDPEMILKGYLDLNKIPQALIFLGENERVKENSARSFAKEVLFQKDSKESHLNKIDRQIHPDYYVFSPKTKTGYYSIEQVKEICSQSALYPHESSAQFFIIQNADRMTDSASNALLKTLEEPTKHTFFILMARNIDLILPTLLSRLQKVVFEERDPHLEKEYAKELQSLLDQGPSFSYPNLYLSLEKIQSNFDQHMLKLKKEKEDIFLDQEAFGLLSQIEKWYQNLLLSNQKNVVPKHVFFKQLQLAKTALERSTKVSTCLEYALMSFVN